MRYIILDGINNKKCNQNVHILGLKTMFSFNRIIMIFFQHNLFIIFSIQYILFDMQHQYIVFIIHNFLQTCANQVLNIDVKSYNFTMVLYWYCITLVPSATRCRIVDRIKLNHQVLVYSDKCRHSYYTYYFISVNG